MTALQLQSPSMQAPFEQADRAYSKLKSRLTSTEMMGTTHGDLEAVVEASGREILRELVQSHLSLRAAQEPVLAVADVDGDDRPHRRSQTSRNLVTVFGPVKVQRASYEGRGVASLRPFDAALNLPRGLHSHGLCRQLCELAARGAVAETVKLMMRYTGSAPAKRQALEIIERSSADFDVFYQTRAAPDTPARDSADFLVLTTDGKGVVMRPEHLRDATREQAENRQHKREKRLSKGEKRGAKRMAQVASVYSIAPFPRTVDQTVAALKPVHAVPSGRPRPHDKRVWASLRHSTTSVVSAMFDEALRRDPDKKRTWVVLVDGNLAQLESILEQGKKRGVPLHIIVDVIHVLEYVWKAGHALFGDASPATEPWVSERFVELLRGNVSTVAAGLRRSATLRKLEGNRRKAVDTCADYLLKYKAYLRYDNAIAAGMPIGTGVIEGACRYLVKDRMDITGARWSLHGAEAVLRLRALVASGDFEAYWMFHQEREMQRNHLVRYQDGKLPASVPFDRNPRHLRLIK